MGKNNDKVCEPMFTTYGMSESLVNSGLPPYTLEELYARIDESHQQYLRGEYVTAEESDEELKREFPWLS